MLTSGYRNYRLKKTAAILFILVLIVSQAGYYFYFTIHQRQAKREIKMLIRAGLPDTALNVITENSRMRWEKKDKEFHLDGEMYDVVKTIKKEGKTVYYCINDKKEKELVSNFARAARDASDQSPQGKNGKHRFSFPVADIPSLVIQQITPPGSNIQTTYSSYTDLLVSSFIEISSPPPRA